MCSKLVPKLDDGVRVEFIVFQVALAPVHEDVLEDLSHARSERDRSEVLYVGWFARLRNENRLGSLPLFGKPSGAPTFVKEVREGFYGRVVEIRECLVSRPVGTGGGSAVEVLQGHSYCPCFNVSI